MNHSEPTWNKSSSLSRSEVPEGWWEWLLDPASLTERLQRACEACFSVELIRQDWDKPLHNEAQAMGLTESNKALIREVYLLCDGKPWVFARTVIPDSTLTGPEQRLMELGNKPLGAVLFSDPTMRRSEVELACIQPDQRLFHAATMHEEQKPEHIWGRRSVFHLNDKPLLVSEIFLPATPKHT